ncbi:MAG TPA: GNAT family N-acetyltransferase [Candidatus Udaeobacter sp.]|nr:GNAT family N-acetyltransferase [Candidatus Udaeobacter sp.]
MTTTTALETLGRDQVVEVLAYLAQDPIETVFLRGLILRAGLDLGRQHGRFMAYRDSSGELGGVILVSSLVVPFATAPEAPLAMAEVLRRSPYPMRNLVGRRETVEALWAATGGWRPQPRLVRTSQPVYTVERDTLQYFPAPELRSARLGDLDLLVQAGAAMMIEEVEEDPLQTRADQYRSFVRDRILRGEEFVWVDAEGLRFKCNVSSVTPEAAQIEGVFTPRARRRAGYAKHGLSETCHRLLNGVPALTLYVNDFNRPAIHLYEQLGFRRSGEYQSIFFS